MAKKWSQGVFVPRHPEKYVGEGNIVWRSGWEHAFMTLCDNHPNVIKWASESVSIPYKNPLTNKNTVYIPDFLIIYSDKNGKQHGELVEIKPKSQTSLTEAKSKRDQLAAVVNQAKWMAAQAWCKKNGLVFRVMTENSLFSQGKKK